MFNLNNLYILLCPYSKVCCQWRVGYEIVNWSIICNTCVLAIIKYLMYKEVYFYIFENYTSFINCYSIYITR